MSESQRQSNWRLTIIAAFFLPAITFADGPRPATQRLLLEGEKFGALSVTHDGAARGDASVAQSDVPAAIYRSTGCGFQNWIGGQPAWLDQMVLFNDGGIGAALRSYTMRVNYDTCHRGNRCIGGTGPADCDCLTCDKLPFDVNFQLYDGDPCGSGTSIAGTQGTFTIDTDQFPCRFGTQSRRFQDQYLGHHACVRRVP